MKDLVAELREKIGGLVKNLARIALLGAYSAVLTYVISYLKPLADVDPFGIYGVILAVAYSVDKYVHDEGILPKGLTRF